MTRPSAGEDNFVNEELQDLYTHPFHMTTRSAIGSICTWLVVLIYIYSDLDISRGLSGRNGRFNCGRTAT